MRGKTLESEIKTHVRGMVVTMLKETAAKNLAEYLKAWSDYNHAEIVFMAAGENLRRTCDRLNGIPAKKQKKGGKVK